MKNPAVPAVIAVLHGGSTSRQPAHFVATTEGGKPGNAHGLARGLCAACYAALPADDKRRVFRPRGAKVPATPSAT